MAIIDTISLSGNTFKNVGVRSIDGLIVSNTDTEDITFDLFLGPFLLHNTTNTSVGDVSGIFILKDIPIPVGSSFVWDDNGVLTNSFKTGSLITNYESKKDRFVKKTNFVFLIRLGSGHTGDVILKRL
tara:strand:- start:417 stop:800 length:384 start_codon:yes stop_codon:yes gene_type:complete